MPPAGSARALSGRWFDPAAGLPVPLVRGLSMLAMPAAVLAVFAPLDYLTRGDSGHPASLIIRICFFGALFFVVYFLPKERRTYLLTDEGLDVPSFPFKRRLIRYREIRSVEVRFGRMGGLTLNLESDETFATMGALVENPYDLAEFIDTRARTARRLAA